jgi:peptidoglycan L-alanyl-D-glutamate endopeptidase CwlK
MPSKMSSLRKSGSISERTTPGSTTIAKESGTSKYNTAMSRDINHLTSHMAMLAEKVQQYCHQHGVDLLIYCTRRTFLEQAKIFRKGRTWQEIKTEINTLRETGFIESAEAIEQAGPQTGDRVTNAAPGESWHNYGMAFDAVPQENGKALWDYDANNDKWDVYEEALYIHGLAWGGDFQSLKDYPHAQLMYGNPLQKLPKFEIKKAAAWSYE